MTSIMDFSFHVDSTGQSMLWKEQLFLMFYIEMVWDELDHRVKEKQPRSAKHIWEFKTVGKGFRVTTS